jgi:hypothetical protein
MRLILAAFAAAASVLAPIAVVQQDDPYKVPKRANVGGEGG